MVAAAAKERHRRFLNRYYGSSRLVYDWTRKYFLFGRDAAIDALLLEPWTTLLEVGSGTGRNLRELQRRRPQADYAGLDASDEMLEHTRSRYPWVKLAQGFAEDADLSAPLSTAPDRILFSYSLSMVGDPEQALLNARRSLAPGGKVLVVDFADLSTVPKLVRRAFVDGWLQKFRVHPLDHRILTEQGAEVRFGPGRYYLLAELGPEV